MKTFRYDGAGDVFDDKTGGDSVAPARRWRIIDTKWHREETDEVAKEYRDSGYYVRIMRRSVSALGDTRPLFVVCVSKKEKP